MNALTVAAPKLLMLIPRLASNQDGEVVALVRTIGRVLRASNLDWHDLAAGIARRWGQSPQANAADRKARHGQAILLLRPRQTLHPQGAALDKTEARQLE